MRKNSGFTLIEVMISLAILSGLSVLIIRSIQSGLASRKKIQADLVRDLRVRDATKIMKSDLTALFFHRDSIVKMQNESLKKKNATPTPNPSTGAPPPTPPPTAQPGGTPLPTPRPTPVQQTGLMGDEKSLFFTTSNHQQSKAEAAEGDLAEVGYYIRDCSPKYTNVEGASKRQATKCLFRSETSTLDGDVQKGGVESVLLENVDKFELKYWFRRADSGLSIDFDQELVTSWDSFNGPEDQKMKIPDAVQIKLSWINPNEPKVRPVEINVLASIPFPNSETATPTPAPGAIPPPSPTPPGRN